MWVFVFDFDVLLLDELTLNFDLWNIVVIELVMWVVWDCGIVVVFVIYDM